jgi:hypothetical protein
MGHGLQRLTQARRGKLLVFIPKGMTRPVVPIIVVKFATECNIVVRNHIPVLKHWSEYKNQSALFLLFFPPFSSNKNNCFLICFYAKYTVLLLAISELF